MSSKPSIEAIIAVREFVAEASKDDTLYRTVWLNACKASTTYALEYLLVYSLGFADAAFLAAGKPLDDTMSKTLAMLIQALQGVHGAIEKVKQYKVDYIRAREQADERAAHEYAKMRTSVNSNQKYN